MHVCVYVYIYIYKILHDIVRRCFPLVSLPVLQPVKELGGEVEEEGGGSGKEKKGSKRLSVERIYQRKTQLEHILLRPDTYVGSTEESTEPMFVFDSERGVIVKRNITYVPGLYKIFDEILGMSCMYLCTP